MPHLSSRISALHQDGSDGWEVFYRARTMVEAGLDVTDLTIGEHDIGTDISILSAMHQAALSGHTGYAMVPGITPLRAEIAKRVNTRTGVPTTVENVLVTTGGQAGLFAAHIAALDPGDTALMIDPYYTTYPGTIRAASGQAVTIPTQAQTAFQPTESAIRTTARQHKARSLLINSPNNPTGTIYAPETLQGIANACLSEDLWLISDEVYESQVWGAKHLSPRALPGMADRTIVIGSMSKGHAMTGSRCGWIIAPPPMIERLIDLSTSTTYGVAGFIQDAALFALQQGDPLEARIAAPFRRRRDLALAELSRQQLVTAIPSQGAMYLMLDIRRTGLSGRDFAISLLKGHHIAVMPGESFGDSAAGHIRLALTVDDTRLITAIRTLCTFATEKAHAA